MYVPTEVSLLSLFGRCRSECVSIELRRVAERRRKNGAADVAAAAARSRSSARRQDEGGNGGQLTVDEERRTETGLRGDMVSDEVTTRART